MSVFSQNKHINVGASTIHNFTFNILPLVLPLYLFLEDYLTTAFWKDNFY